ncbi:MAG: LysM peptidoglycan-binding domain-containing protein [Phycisphaeraceae bacterium]|nr:MAG: LysM peptidoglycan-binding domain-containing protein [Phycisphaeraceae bacterium]
MLAALLLVGVWIVTYWLWPAPDRIVNDAGITFGEAAEVERAEPAPREPESPRPTPPSRPEPEPEPEPVIEPEPEEERSGVIPPRFEEYVVDERDTIATISERFFGSPDEWRIVARANPLVDINRLRVGQRLLIPVDPDNIQGVPVGPEAEKPPAAPEPEYFEYIVARGDTLSAIAHRYYNRSSDWRLILDANRDTITAPEQIRPGMRLRIPPASRRAGEEG